MTTVWCALAVVVVLWWGWCMAKRDERKALVAATVAAVRGQIAALVVPMQNVAKVMVTTGTAFEEFGRRLREASVRLDEDDQAGGSTW